MESNLFCGLGQDINEPEFIAKHLNKSAYFFYGYHGGDILAEENFPSLVKEYLADESRIISALISSGPGYTALFEIACADARNIGMATRHNLNYYGIDFIQACIDQAKEKLLKEEGINKFVIKCLSATDLGSLTTPVLPHERVLAIFPFNALGNMEHISSILSAALNLNYDVFISVFNVTEEANKERRKYYKKCGLSNIEIRKNDTGVIFTSAEGLKSIAYSDAYLAGLIKKLNAKCDVINGSCIGSFYYIRK